MVGKTVIWVKSFFPESKINSGNKSVTENAWFIDNRKLCVGVADHHKIRKKDIISFKTVRHELKLWEMKVVILMQTLEDVLKFDEEEKTTVIDVKYDNWS